MKTEHPTSIKSLLRHQRPTMLRDSKVKRIITTENNKTIIFNPSSTKSLAKRHFSDGTTTTKRPLEPYIRSKSQTLRNNTGLQNRNILNYKALAFSRAVKPRIGSSIPVKQLDESINTKVGLFASSGTLGQTIQGIGSVALPGDMSEIRSPIRSRIYAALTPGGGGRRGILPRETRGFRCPAGFAFGGRFTDSRYSTCGAQLFEVPSLGRTIGRALGGGNRGVGEARAESISEVIQGVNTEGRALQISRMAQIPRSGAENPKARAAAASQAITSLAGTPSGEGRLIRKDGIVLRPVVPSSVLRNFGGNPDMENGVLIRSIDKPSDIVGDDLALLSGPAIRQVSYVTPNGSVLTIERQRDLTVGERRKFGRQLNRAAGESDQFDVGNNIREFANNSGGAFKYTEKFPNVPKPLDLIEVEDSNGTKRSVRRWVYETFMTNKGKGKISAPVENRTLREDGADINEVPTSIAEATKFLDEGGSPFDIPSEFVSDALRRSDKYQARKLGTGITEYSDGGGKVIYQVPETRKNGAIAERYYSDVASQLGLKTPPVRFAGSGTDRETIVGDIANDGGRVDYDQPLDKVDAEDVLRVFMADFLSDARDRSPATLRPVRTQQKLTVVPSANELSSLAGLDSEEIAERFKLDISDYLDNRQAGIFRSRFANLSSSQRNQLVGIYDSLIDRAKKFNWSEYASRMSADGKLSKVEQAHLDILKKLYGQRLEALIKQKKQTIQLLGI